LSIILSITSWKDELTFFKSQVQTLPNCVKAYNDLWTAIAAPGIDVAATASSETSATYPQMGGFLYGPGK
tara:strand:+ start:418 stop:627 length:210 start_codon:yes stop_codon:yes gene_type:complete